VFDRRVLTRDLLLRWMERETPPDSAPATCLSLAIKFESVVAAQEALDVHPAAPLVTKKDTK
jgi:hypothetical protein